MKKGNCLFFLIVATLLVVAHTPACALTLTTYPASSFSSDTVAMDDALGITGYVIEDFEDSILVDGLSVTGSYWNAQWASSGQWDGTRVLKSWSTNNVTFNIASGATSFGVGLGQFEPYSYSTNLYVSVNGESTDFGNILTDPNCDPSGPPYRNMYIKIDVGPGEIIDAVGFDIGGSVDMVYFDHLAFQPVPEPTTMLLLGTGLIGLAGARRRKSKM
jgi:hypothetical protein